MADLQNCSHLAHKDTIVILDDVIIVNTQWIVPCRSGPAKAWQTMLYNGKINYIIGKEYSSGRGMVWGKYIV